MDKCLCILASGPRKGSQCSNQAKPGTTLCGIHRKCQFENPLGADELVDARHLSSRVPIMDYQSSNQFLKRETPDQALLGELPSMDWLETQERYLRSIKPTDSKIISFYTHHGDIILNNFARHGWTITENDFDYLRVNYDEGISEIFKDLMQALKLNNDDPVELLLMEIYNRLNQIIIKSPINPQRFICYRGSQTMDYFQQSRKIFQNVGFFSTTLLVKKAVEFSKGKYMTRIIVSAGYQCLYLESQTLHKNEYEILMPDQSQYYITSGFQEHRYGSKFIPTNELVIIKTKPKLLVASSLTTHHHIRDLIIDPRVRHLLKKMLTLIPSMVEDSSQYRKIHQLFPRVWLRRLAEQKIYTLLDVHARGNQFHPTLAEITDTL